MLVSEPRARSRNDSQFIRYFKEMACCAMLAVHSSSVNQPRECATICPVKHVLFTRYGPDALLSTDRAASAARHLLEVASNSEVADVCANGGVVSQMREVIVT